MKPINTSEHLLFFHIRIVLSLEPLAKDPFGNLINEKIAPTCPNNICTHSLVV